jgi:hypothetical protein
MIVIPLIVVMKHLSLISSVDKSIGTQQLYRAFAIKTLLLAALLLLGLVGVWIGYVCYLASRQRFVKIADEAFFRGKQLVEASNESENLNLVEVKKYLCSESLETLFCEQFPRGPERLTTIQVGPQRVVTGKLSQDSLHNEFFLDLSDSAGETCQLRISCDSDRLVFVNSTVMLRSHIGKTVKCTGTIRRRYLPNSSEFEQLRAWLLDSSRPKSTPIESNRFLYRKTSAFMPDPDEQFSRIAGLPRLEGLVYFLNVSAVEMVPDK